MSRQSAFHGTDRDRAIGGKVKEQLGRQAQHLALAIIGKGAMRRLALDPQALIKGERIAQKGENARGS